MSGNDVLLALGPFAFYATAPSFEKFERAAEILRACLAENDADNATENRAWRS